MGVIAAAVIGMLVLMLHQPPETKVVLLPDADGRTGAVVIRSEAESATVNTAYGSAVVGQRGAITKATEDRAAVSQKYETTLGARPSAPVSFLVYFEFGSAVDIAPAIRPMLDQLRAAIVTFPAAQITIIGHTDRVGTLESNDALSLGRAQTVREHIEKAGIQAHSIEVAGRGEREPLVPTADEVAEPRNRRVEVQLR